jgi:ubiquitin carboxyl-terminal hydrolase 10
LPDYTSRTGLRVEATKQVFLESFPPVLILHLKRFLYDNVGGTQKSGKKIGYGTSLEIREEIIAPGKRTGNKVAYQLFGGESQIFPDPRCSLEATTAFKY